jgi:hypothetical protein
MVQIIRSPTGGPDYEVEDLRSTPKGEVALTVRRLSDPIKWVGEIEWVPGAAAFHIDGRHDAAKAELESLFPYLLFQGPVNVGHVLGCKTCGTPMVVPYGAPDTGTVSCANGDANTYTLPP